MELEEPAGGGTYDELLSNPTHGEALEIKRVEAKYTNKGERFRLATRAYDRQYAQIYYQRLMLMKPRLLERAAERWPGVPVSSILSLPEAQDRVVLGTLYKDMKLKPSILDEYVKDRGASQLTGNTRFVGSGDALILEDDGARMALRGAALPVDALVTGVVMAARGQAVPGGDFLVQDFCFVGLAPQDPPPQLPDDRYVALLSGLGVGDAAADPLRLSLVVDYLMGALGGAAEQRFVAKIARVIIAGGLLSSTEGLSQATTHTKGRAQAAALAPVKEVDLCMSELASAVPVDVMPGHSDPANHSLPQQPLHGCLLPGASGYTTFNRTTNPHDCELDGVHLIGTSGQNVDDVWRYSAEEDRLAILERTLEWGHLVPTAPDTLTCYPFHASDPFVLQRTPHVLFAGNQPEFGARMLQGPEGQRVLLVAVPRFATSGVLVLVNLRTLAVRPVHFDSSLT